jgi:hypothetical protein
LQCGGLARLWRNQGSEVGGQKLEAGRRKKEEGESKKVRSLEDEKKTNLLIFSPSELLISGL